MKTMRIIALLLCLAAPLLAQSQSEKERHAAQITFRVVTDDGAPVPNVEVAASTFLFWKQGEGFGQDVYETTKARTDGDGVAKLIFTSERGDCRYGIFDVPGYYATRNLQYQLREAQDGKWQPWNPTVEVVLKPILKPVPMYARKVGDIAKPCEIPAADKPVGFDLLVGDWVAPYGQGKTADLLFAVTENVAFVTTEKPFDLSLGITFSNEGDGIQSVRVPIDQGSELRLPRFAPENGYQTSLLKRIARIEGKAIDAGVREDENYFFRVRTVLDEKGRIKSALYGKIVGDVQFWGNRRVRFTYYLNATSLDRNMEFDPRHNLFVNLPSLEQVNAP
jgi:hypothetical protein